MQLPPQREADWLYDLAYSRVEAARDHGRDSRGSHRSGETEDAFLANLVAGICTGLGKTRTLTVRTGPRINSSSELEEPAARPCVSQKFRSSLAK